MPNKINQQGGVKVPENKGLLTEIHEVTSLLARRIVGEASRKHLSGSIIVQFNTEADKAILSKIREVVEGAGLNKDLIQKHCIKNGQAPMTEAELKSADYGAFIQLQAILKAIDKEGKQ